LYSETHLAVRHRGISGENCGSLNQKGSFGYLVLVA
jgi:hypothetical protein